jgi:hypothetical protein
MDIKYIIIDFSDADKINYDEVFENSPSTLRVSKSNETFIHYNGQMPQSVQSLKSKSQEYTIFQILELLEGDDWINFDNGITGNTNNY